MSIKSNTRYLHKAEKNLRRVKRTAGSTKNDLHYWQQETNRRRSSVYGK